MVERPAQQITVGPSSGRRAPLCSVLRSLIALLLGFCWSPHSPAAADDGIEWFERRIRPLLVEHCIECHGPVEQKGGLRLDHRGGWELGGDSGPALSPGDPDNSLLVSAVRYEGLEMPPRGRLSDEDIAALETWIRSGAADPRDVPPEMPDASETSSVRPASEHWAYLPLQASTPPAVQDVAWPITAIDRFLLADLETADLAPVRDAPRAVLARRLAIDLCGMSLTPEQVDAFASDTRPDAYERLVDRLLSSPAFGETWARHWLDVVRFGESVTLRGFIYREAWRYRDYVIEQFQHDRSYAQFVREQVAGDLLDADNLTEQQRQLIATTFLMLGNINYEEQDKQQLEMDVVDEQLDTIGKAFLAQTIGCARCHDHKFDPISTRNYYAMAGILKGSRALEHDNVSKWIERPLPLSPADERTQAAREQAVAGLQARRDQALQHARELAKTSGGTSIPAVGGINAADLPGIVVDSQAAKSVGRWQLSRHTKPYIGDGYLHDQDGDKGRKTITFEPQLPSSGRYEVRLAYTAGTNRAPAVPVTILHADGESTVLVNQQKPPEIAGLFVSLGAYRFEAGNQGFVLISNYGTQGHVVADAVQFIAADQLSPEIAVDPSANEAIQQAEAELKSLEQQLSLAKQQLPRRPAVMTVRPEGPYQDLAVHVRGSVHQLGQSVPRGVLDNISIAAGTPQPSIASDSCGRDALADWITDQANPLAARVYVNRVWHWLFGSGLVRSVDNFGTTGDAPSHAALLDYLARRLIEEHCSTKWLVRELVTSHVYRLSTDADPRGLLHDPENRLWGRMNRRRLTAEAIRDTMLQASGELVHLAGGCSYPSDLEADYGYQHEIPCRSIFVPAFRNAIHELLAVFDYPDPSMVQGERSESTVAPQALLLMNHPEVTERAARTASRLMREPLADDNQRLHTLYRWLLGRPPRDREAQIITQFLLRTGPAADEESLSQWTSQEWTQVVQALYAAPDFQLLD